MPKTQRTSDSLDVWAAKAAALLAQRAHCPQMWEAGIAHYLKQEVLAMGDDGSARALMLALAAARNRIDIS